MMTSKRGGALTGLPTLGAALLGILDDLKKYAQAVKDFRLAHNAKEMSDSLKAREEMRRMREISQRQESDQHGVQGAHMMQARESRVRTRGLGLEGVGFGSCAMNATPTPPESRKAE